MPIEICGLSVFMGKECHTPPPTPAPLPEMKAGSSLAGAWGKMCLAAAHWSGNKFWFPIN